MSYVYDLIEKEKLRQNNELCLIASENIASSEVLGCMNSVLSNKYAEGYPNHRYYGGCEVVDKIEQYAIDKAKQLFKCKWANVQPHSGSQANQAVYLALCNSGDTILGMDLNAGGHLTHGAKVSSSGKLYNTVSYGLDDNGIINYEEIRNKLYTYLPKILIVGASAYSRTIDFEKIRKIVDEYNEWVSSCKKIVEEYCASSTHDSVTHYKISTPVGDIIYCTDNEFLNYNSVEHFNLPTDKVDIKELEPCYFMVDMAHIAGLVAGNQHTSPLPYADVVTSTTHKTLRGPRGGLILSNDEKLGKKIDKAVFPGIQGGPLMNTIAAKAVCFEEALLPSFKNYAKKVVSNTRLMCSTIMEEGIPVISGGTDNHLFLLDLRNFKCSGAEVEKELQKIGIIVNKNSVVGDQRPISQTSGVRIGLANLTTRGISRRNVIKLGRIIAHVVYCLDLNVGINTKNCKEAVASIIKNIGTV